MNIRSTSMNKAKAILVIIRALKQRDMTIQELKAAVGTLESSIRSYVRLLIDLGVCENLNPGRGVVTHFRFIEGWEANIAEERLVRMTQATVIPGAGYKSGVNVEEYLLTGKCPADDVKSSNAAAQELQALFFARPPTNFISLGDDHANTKAALLSHHPRA